MTSSAKTTRFVTRREYDSLVRRCSAWMDAQWARYQKMWFLGGVQVTERSLGGIENLEAQLASVAQLEANLAVGTAGAQLPPPR